MQTVELFTVNGQQAVKLPESFRFEMSAVSVRKQGDAVILEPIRSDAWPEGFFESIRIDDPSFVRPSQGQMPPAPCIG